MLRLLRPKQWIKNLLVFAALVFSGELFHWQSLALAVLGFVSFCLAASSTYVVNDLLDAERDRLHPEKRDRPIASGQVGPVAGGVLAAVLTGLAFGTAVGVGPAFALWILLYVFLTHFYSLVGKNLVIVDTMLIAAGFVIRAVAGAVAIGVPSSDWFVLCTMFLALFVALSKRRAEMLAMGEAASSTRPVLGGYDRASLMAFMATSMAALLISYALYVRDSLEEAGTSFQMMELSVPFVVFVVFRYFLLVESGRFGEKPEELVVRDRPIQGGILGFALVVLVALYGLG